MSVRNDPCPCGSGRKYKHCCRKTGALVRPRGNAVSEAVRIVIVVQPDGNFTIEYPADKAMFTLDALESSLRVVKAQAIARELQPKVQAAGPIDISRIRRG